jgi:hypothetical protein
LWWFAESLQCDTSSLCAALYDTFGDRVKKQTPAGTIKRLSMRAFLAAMIAATVLTQSAYAQQHGPPSKPQLTDEQKAKIQDKRSFEKDTDEAYKSTLKKMPDVKQNVDPWGNLRAPAEQPRGK